MLTLRPYQKEASERGVEFLTTETKQNGAIMILPTGSGKSVIIADIVMKLPGNTIILQPSKEILEQNYAKIKLYGMTDCSIYSASLFSKEISKLTYATIGSIIKRKELWSHFDNIIIDECHLVNHEGGQYAKFIAETGKKVLGLTATPYRLKTYEMGSMLKFITRVRNGIFQKVIHVTQIEEIASEGFLADLEYYELKAIDTSKLRTNTTGSDYSDRSLRNYFDEVDVKGSIISVVKRLFNAEKKRKHILIFVPFVEDAKEIAKRLQNENISSAFVSGTTKKREREEIIEGFKYGSIKVVVNVGVLTTGFDFPGLDTIILARPTKSLALYYQMVGRGMRPHETKESCRIIDMAEVNQRFGEVKDLKLYDEGNGKRVVKSGRKSLTNTFIQ